MFLVGTSRGAIQFRHDGDKGKIFLKETPENIQLLDTFFMLKNEKREQLLKRLSIFKNAELLVNLDAHGCISEFGCGYFDDSRRSLKQKISTSLKQEMGQCVKIHPTVVECFQERGTWRPEVKSRFEEVLRRVIRPVSTVLFEWSPIKRVKSVDCNSNGTMITVLCEDGSGEIRCAKYGSILFKESGLDEISLDSSGTLVKLYSKNGDGEIRDINSGEVFFEDGDVEDMDLKSVAGRVVVEYSDCSQVIINLKNRERLCCSDGIRFYSAGMRRILCCGNGQAKIIGLNDEGEEVLFEGNNVQSINLNSTGVGAVIFNGDGVYKIIDLANGEKLLSRDDIDSIYLNSTNRRALVWYGNYKAEIIDLKDEDKKVLCTLDDIDSVGLNSANTMIIVLDGNDRGKIIDFEKGKVLFESDKVDSMYLSATNRHVVVNHKNGEKEIRDLESGEKIFGGNGIRKITLSSAGTKAIIDYDNGRIEVRGLDDGELLFKGDRGDIERIHLNLNDTMLVIHYEGGKREIRDLEGYNQSIDFTGLSKEQLLFMFGLRNLSFSSYYQ